MKNQLKRGFTLIEIVIVLAIAALIMVVVFLAVQGAQRSQRDQFRKDTANRVLSAAVSFKGNSSGVAPANASALAQYINGGSGTTVTGGGITLTLDTATAAPASCAAPGTNNITYAVVSGKDQAFACLEVGTLYTASN